MLFQLKFVSKSFFLPAQSIDCWAVSIPSAGRLSEIVLLEEQNILDNTQPHDNEADPTWLTARLWQYNFLDLDYPEIQELKEFIRQQYVDYSTRLGYVPGKTYIQCWANIIRDNQRCITPHEHACAHAQAPGEYSHVSGNLCLQADNTRTYYKNPVLPDMAAPIDNAPGEMILFPSYIVHWTDQNTSKTPRISIAFDIITEEVYNMINNHNFRELTPG
jgi:hypothetical protein